MKTSRNPALWQICITASEEAQEACVEALTDAFGVSATDYLDFETRVAQVSVYLEGKPAQLEEKLDLVRARLQAAKQAGLKIGAGKIQCRILKRENWAESWKRHFKPISIGKSLLLKPSWTRRKAERGQKVIVLDPGLSFGTGQHATTSFCLREVVRFRARGGGSFLDMGTGSGILAIAAAKLGCSPVEAFDFDPEAVRVAQENARRNRVTARINIAQADLTRLPRRTVKQFDLVCANLISNLLLAEKERIVARLAPEGTLVLAGILKTEFSHVRRTFEALGMKLIRWREEKEWASGAFVRDGKRR